ncbi:hypothetical protein BVX98_07730 [bacterium F11]|nr:hypothetical protein BVX98_07730 [bacterium F11]
MVFKKVFRKLAVVVITVLFAIQNSGLIHAAESNFWEERRQSRAQQREEIKKSYEAAQSLKDHSNLVASLPKVDGSLALPFSGKALTDLGISNDLQTEKKAELAKKWVPDWMQVAIAPYATIHEVHLSKNPKSKTVLLVQDAHLHFEAQKNIAGVIDEIGRALTINKEEHILVGLEGADIEEADYSLYNEFPFRKELRQAGEAFLKANILSGPEFAVIGFQGDGEEGPVSLPMKITGVEDQAEYDANVKALQDSVPLKERAKSALNEFKRALVELKREKYGKSHFVYDTKLNDFEKGTLGVPDYVLYLDSIVPATGQNLRELISAALLEGSIDFKKVERERAAILNILVKKMTESEIKTLLQFSTLYRSGKLSYAAYYGHLKKLARRHGVDFKTYPEMGLYIQYVLKSEGIDPAGLFSEIREHEKRVQNKLFNSTGQKEIAYLTQDYHLLQKLSEHVLTEEEWYEYETRTEKINGLSSRFEKLGHTLPMQLAEMTPQWTIFENFYRAALKRNKTMAGKLATHLNQDTTDVAILVAGGFHSQGLVRELKSHNLTVLTVSPKITDVGGSLSSLDFLSANQTPLDQLFRGERLFLTLARASIMERLRVCNLLRAMVLAVIRPLQRSRANVDHKEKPSGAVQVGDNALAQRVDEALSTEALDPDLVEATEFDMGEFTVAVGEIEPAKESSRNWLPTSPIGVSNAVLVASLLIILVIPAVAFPMGDGIALIQTTSEAANVVAPVLSTPIEPTQPTYMAASFLNVSADSPIVSNFGWPLAIGLIVFVAATFDYDRLLRMIRAATPITFRRIDFRAWELKIGDLKIEGLDELMEKLKEKEQEVRSLTEELGAEDRAIFDVMVGSPDQEATMYGRFQLLRRDLEKDYQAKSGEIEQIVSYLQTMSDLPARVQVARIVEIGKRLQYYKNQGMFPGETLEAAYDTSAVLKSIIEALPAGPGLSPTDRVSSSGSRLSLFSAFIGIGGAGVGATASNSLVESLPGLVVMAWLFTALGGVFLAIASEGFSWQRIRNLIIIDRNATSASVSPVPQPVLGKLEADSQGRPLTVLPVLERLDGSSSARTLSRPDAERIDRAIRSEMNLALRFLFGEFKIFKSTWGKVLHFALLGIIVVLAIVVILSLATGFTPWEEFVGEAGTSSTYASMSGVVAIVFASLAASTTTESSTAVDSDVESLTVRAERGLQAAYETLLGRFPEDQHKETLSDFRRAGSIALHFLNKDGTPSETHLDIILSLESLIRSLERNSGLLIRANNGQETDFTRAVEAGPLKLCRALHAEFRSEYNASLPLTVRAERELQEAFRRLEQTYSGNLHDNSLTDLRRQLSFLFRDMRSEDPSSELYPRIFNFLNGQLIPKLERENDLRRRANERPFAIALDSGVLQTLRSLRDDFRAAIKNETARTEDQSVDQLAAESGDVADGVVATPNLFVRFAAGDFQIFRGRLGRALHILIWALIVTSLIAIVGILIAQFAPDEVVSKAMENRNSFASMMAVAPVIGELTRPRQTPSPDGVTPNTLRQLQQLNEGLNLLTPRLRASVSSELRYVLFFAFAGLGVLSVLWGLPVLFETSPSWVGVLGSFFGVGTLGIALSEPSLRRRAVRQAQIRTNGDSWDRLINQVSDDGDNWGRTGLELQLNPLRRFNDEARTTIGGLFGNRDVHSGDRLRANERVSDDLNGLLNRYDTPEARERLFGNQTDAGNPFYDRTHPGYSMLRHLPGEFDRYLARTRNLRDGLSGDIEQGRTAQQRQKDVTDVRAKETRDAQEREATRAAIVADLLSIEDRLNTLRSPAYSQTYTQNTQRPIPLVEDQVRDFEDPETYVDQLDDYVDTVLGLIEMFDATEPVTQEELDSIVVYMDELIDMLGTFIEALDLENESDELHRPCYEAVNLARRVRQRILDEPVATRAAEADAAEAAADAAAEWTAEERSVLEPQLQQIEEELADLIEGDPLDVANTDPADYNDDYVEGLLEDLDAEIGNEAALQGQGQDETFDLEQARDVRGRLQALTEHEPLTVRAQRELESAIGDLRYRFPGSPFLVVLDPLRMFFIRFFEMLGQTLHPNQLYPMIIRQLDYLIGFLEKVVVSNADSQEFADAVESGLLAVAWNLRNDFREAIGQPRLERKPEAPVTDPTATADADAAGEATDSNKSGATAKKVDTAAPHETNGKATKSKAAAKGPQDSAKAGQPATTDPSNVAETNGRAAADTPAATGDTQTAETSQAVSAAPGAPAPVDPDASASSVQTASVAPTRGESFREIYDEMHVRIQQIKAEMAKGIVPGFGMDIPVHNRTEAEAAFMAIAAIIAEFQDGVIASHEGLHFDCMMLFNFIVMGEGADPADVRWFNLNKPIVKRWLEQDKLTAKPEFDGDSQGFRLVLLLLKFRNDPLIADILDAFSLQGGKYVGMYYVESDGRRFADNNEMLGRVLGQHAFLPGSDQGTVYDVLQLSQDAQRIITLTEDTLYDIGSATDETSLARAFERLRVGMADLVVDIPAERRARLYNAIDRMYDRCYRAVEEYYETLDGNVTLTGSEEAVREMRELQSSSRRTRVNTFWNRYVTPGLGNVVIRDGFPTSNWSRILRGEPRVTRQHRARPSPAERQAQAAAEAETTTQTPADPGMPGGWSGRMAELRQQAANQAAQASTTGEEESTATDATSTDGTPTGDQQTDRANGSVAMEDVAEEDVVQEDDPAAAATTGDPDGTPPASPRLNTGAAAIAGTALVLFAVSLYAFGFDFGPMMENFIMGAAGTSAVAFMAPVAARDSPGSDSTGASAQQQAYNPQTPPLNILWDKLVQVPLSIKLLFVVNLAIYIFEWYTGAHIAPKISPLAVNPDNFQLWQLATYAFSHGSLQHFGFNSFFLLYYGPKVAKRLGVFKFSVVYMTAAVVGGLAHLMLNPLYPMLGMPGSSVVGASGALFGVLMAYGILFAKEKHPISLLAVVLMVFGINPFLIALVAQQLLQVVLKKQLSLTFRVNSPVIVFFYLGLSYLMDLANGGGMTTSHLAHIAGAAAPIPLFILAGIASFVWSRLRSSSTTREETPEQDTVEAPSPPPSDEARDFEYGKRNSVELAVFTVLSGMSGVALGFSIFVAVTAGLSGIVLFAIAAFAALFVVSVVLMFRTYYEKTPVETSAEATADAAEAADATSTDAEPTEEQRAELEQRRAEVRARNDERVRRAALPRGFNRYGFHFDDIDSTQGEIVDGEPTVQLEPLSGNDGQRLSFLLALAAVLSEGTDRTNALLAAIQKDGYLSEFETELLLPILRGDEAVNTLELVIAKATDGVDADSREFTGRKRLAILFYIVRNPMAEDVRQLRYPQTDADILYVLDRVRLNLAADPAEPVDGIIQPSPTLLTVRQVLNLHAVEVPAVAATEAETTTAAASAETTETTSTATDETAESTPASADAAGTTTTGDPESGQPDETAERTSGAVDPSASETSTELDEQIERADMRLYYEGINQIEEALKGRAVKNQQEAIDLFNQYIRGRLFEFSQINFDELSDDALERVLANLDENLMDLAILFTGQDRHDGHFNDQALEFLGLLISQNLSEDGDITLLDRLVEITEKMGNDDQDWREKFIIEFKKAEIKFNPDAGITKLYTRHENGKPKTIVEVSHEGVQSRKAFRDTGELTTYSMSGDAEDRGTRRMAGAAAMVGFALLAAWSMLNGVPAIGPVELQTAAAGIGEGWELLAIPLLLLLGRLSGSLQKKWNSLSTSVKSRIATPFIESAVIIGFPLTVDLATSLLTIPVVLVLLGLTRLPLFGIDRRAAQLLHVLTAVVILVALVGSFHEAYYYFEGVNGAFGLPRTVFADLAPPAVLTGLGLLSSSDLTTQGRSRITPVTDQERAEVRGLLESVIVPVEPFLEDRFKSRGETRVLNFGLDMDFVPGATDRVTEGLKNYEEADPETRETTQEALRTATRVAEEKDGKMAFVDSDLTVYGEADVPQNTGFTLFDIEGGNFGMFVLGVRQAKNRRGRTRIVINGTKADFRRELAAANAEMREAVQTALKEAGNQVQLEFVRPRAKYNIGSTKIQSALRDILKRRWARNVTSFTIHTSRELEYDIDALNIGRAVPLATITEVFLPLKALNDVGTRMLLAVVSRKHA